MLFAGERSPSEVDTRNTTVSPQIWVITDIHYLADSLRDDGEYLTHLIEDGDAKNLFILDELMEGFLKEIREKRPDALLITGDLTFNGLNFFSGTEFLNQSRIEEQNLDLDLCLAISPAFLSSYLQGKLIDTEPFDLYHRF